jgi:hypothetical protein
MMYQRIWWWAWAALHQEEARQIADLEMQIRAVNARGVENRGGVENHGGAENSRVAENSTGAENAAGVSTA